MSGLAALRFWRASVVNASTTRIRWPHTIERISRQSGLSLLRASSTSTTQVGDSEQSTSVEEAKLPHPNGPTRSEPNDPPLLATVEPEQSMKDLNAKEKNHHCQDAQEQLFQAANC